MSIELLPQHLEFRGLLSDEEDENDMGVDTPDDLEDDLDEDDDNLTDDTDDAVAPEEQ